MDFNLEEFERIVKKFEELIPSLQSKLDDVPSVVAKATDHWYVTDDIESFIKMVGRKIVEFGSWLLSTIKDLLKGIAAPVYMAMAAWDWYEVRGTVTQCQADINPDQSKALREWKGQAATNYKTTSTTQKDAAKRVGEIAEKTATALAACAAGGAVFYAAVLASFAKGIEATAAAIAALGSGVFSWAGVCLVFEEAVSQPVTIWTLVTGLTALIGAQVSQLAAMQSGLTDNSAFPGGKWPGANTDSFSDATRFDGTASWSVIG
ncbi:hypothetical protein [Nocardia sp. NPDC005825]|uniref:hypothetical protein n=1 Tax=unclassified Nocardia TaxID=2637762 RepID=UPI0033F045B1